jgi:ABC-type phosphate/phosphonate transport system permease subunit
MDNQTLFYICGIAAAVSAVVVSLIGLKVKSFPGKAFPLVILWFAILPQIIPVFVGNMIFEWDINIRRSTIMGLVGAGGLGLVFFRQMAMLNYGGVATVILAVLCLIIFGEIVSHYARKAVL